MSVNHEALLGRHDLRSRGQACLILVFVGVGAAGRFSVHSTGEQRGRLN